MSVCVWTSQLNPRIRLFLFQLYPLSLNCPFYWKFGPIGVVFWESLWLQFLCLECLNAGRVFEAFCLLWMFSWWERVKSEGRKEEEKFVIGLETSDGISVGFYLFLERWGESLLFLKCLSLNVIKDMEVIDDILSHYISKIFANLLFIFILLFEYYWIFFQQIVREILNHI